MKLIREDINEVSILTERTETGEKKLYITGPFLEAETVNKNRRKYPLEIMKKEVDRFNTECVKANRGLGTLDHQDTPHVSLDRVSHKITSLEQDGNLFIGKALVLDTACGNILRGLIDGGVQLGVSSRALGSLTPTNEGYSIVNDDFNLISIDCVSNNSAPSAFVRGILEGVEYYYDAAKGTYIEKQIEQLYENAKKYPKKKLEENALGLFNWYLKNITIKQ